MKQFRKSMDLINWVFGEIPRGIFCEFWMNFEGVSEGMHESFNKKNPARIARWIPGWFSKGNFGIISTRIYERFW